MSRLEISGGASGDETAAIAVVVANVLAEEERARANPLPRPRQSDWVLAWRPRNLSKSVSSPFRLSSSSDKSTDEEE